MRVGAESKVKTRAQLVDELSRLRERIVVLEGEAAARAAAEPWTTSPAAATLGSMIGNPFEDAEARQRIAALLPSILYVFDVVEQRNVLCSSTVQSVLGYSADDLHAMGDTVVSSLLHPDDLARFPERMQRYAEMADGEVTEWQYLARRADGSYRWLHSHEVVLRRLPDGRPWQILGVAHDVTALKESEDAIQRSHRRLERQNAVLLEFASSAALAHGDREAGLAAITEATSRTLDVAQVSVWLFDEARRNLVCHDAFDGVSGHHTRGLCLEGSAFPEFLAALSSVRVLAIDDAEHDPRARELYHVIAAPRGVTSMLEAGVRRGNNLIGVLCCDHLGPARRWMVEEETFAGSMADVIARVMETNDTRRMEVFQAATLRIAEAASKDRDLEALFRLARATLAEATHARSVHIVVRDPASEALHEIVADPMTRVDTDYVRGVQTAIEQVVASGQPLRCPIQALVAMEETAPRAVSGEWFGVPLLSDNGTLGVLALEWDHAPETGGAAMPRFLGEVASHLAHAVERVHREQALRDRARQQAAAAELGLLALGIADVPSLFDATVRLVARTLDVEFCKVIELLPDGSGFVPRAGVGWPPGLAGTIISAGLDSQAGYTLVHGGPVIVRDLRHETRFNGPELHHEHGVVSGLSTVIQTGAERRFVIGAHTTKARAFTWDDAMFLQAAANVVAVALSRLRMQSALQASEARLQKALESVEHARDLQEDHDFALQVVNGLPQPVFVNSAEGRCVFVNPAGVRFLNHTLADILEKDVSSFIFPEDRPLAKQALEDRRAGHTTTYEVRLLTADDQLKSVLVTGAPRFRAGQFIGTIAIALDLEPLKAAQDQVLALETQARQRERERRLQVVQAQDEERAALSHEIHEGLGQLMVGLHMTLVARNLAHGDLADEIANARQAVAAAARLSRQLHPPELESKGVFRVVVEQLCTPHDVAGASVRAHCSGSEPELSRSQKGLLYRMACIAVERALRVGHATVVDLTFTWTGSDLDLRVVDDGARIPDDEADITLRSIRDRASLLDGEAWLEHAEDRNHLLIRVHLREHERAPAPHA